MPESVFPKHITEWREWVLNRDYVDHEHGALTTRPRCRQIKFKAIFEHYALLHSCTAYLYLFYPKNLKHVGSMVEWLKHRAHDQHSLGSKSSCAILLCPWERHLRHFPLLQAVLNYNHISIKFQADNSILASPEAGRGNCLAYVLAPPSLSCESGG